jgi:hypothetical protein
MSRVCPYCSQPFVPSWFRPAQRVCSQPDCQQRRRRDYHRQKLQADPLYRQVCRDSQQKWRADHPDYPRQYRQAHPDYVHHNRQRQHRRDQHRRLAHLVKNNLAFDLKHSSHEVWLMGPQTTDLVKNNLACSKVLIFETVSGLVPAPEPLAKNIPLVVSPPRIYNSGHPQGGDLRP